MVTNNSYPLFGLLSAVVIAAASPQDVCISTPTSCQCSTSTPSGTCLRSQGDGTCLLGLCLEGYRCDCFGYELCSVAKCGKHVPIGGAIPSETVPFQCKLTPKVGQCTKFDDFVDTVSGANNAESEATTSNDEASTDETDATRDIEEIQSEKKAINQVLKEVERLADDMPDAELEDIEAEVAIIIEAVEEATEVVVDAIKNAKKAAEALRDLRRFKRIARRRERLANQKKEVLKKEEAKKGSRDKVMVAKLKEDITALTSERQNAAKMSGGKAKEAKDFKKRCNQKREEVRKIKDKVRVAASRCMQKAQKSLGKAGARIIV